MKRSVPFFRWPIALSALVASMKLAAGQVEILAVKVDPLANTVILTGVGFTAASTVQLSTEPLASTFNPVTGQLIASLPEAGLVGSYPLTVRTKGDLSDALDITLGIQGPPGPPGINGQDGRGIVTSFVDLNGHLIVTYSDGVSYDLGLIVGPKGDSGAPGAPGAPGAAGPQGLPGEPGIQGVPGATGPQGPKGDKGDTGATGPQGEQGVAGATGATGPQGPVGLKGDKGDTGATGPQGEQGIPGATGPQGPKGDQGGQGVQGIRGDEGRGVVTSLVDANGHLIVTYTDGTVVDLGGIVGAKGDKGDTGATGPQGEQGIAGATGATGPQGPVGLQGDKGDTGAAGPQGEQGIQGVAGATGATGPQGPVGLQGDKGDTGATGPQGEQGIPGATGPQGPKGDQGIQGDEGRGVVTSVVDANGHLIVTYTDGTMVDLGGIVGAKGDKGDKGDAGTTGPQGEQGVAGATGATGPQGPVGLKGDKGDTGATGPQGPVGPKGDTGATGLPGEQGVPGATGPQGPVGLKGDKGDTGATGAQGEPGIQGATGPQGTKGDPGDQGIQGIQGDEGRGVVTSVVDANGHLIVTYTDGTVVDLGGIVGAKGDKGDKGDTGATGPQGEQGVVGATGATGPQGPKGDQGDQGDQGIPGEIGPQGIPGIQGDDGRGVVTSVVDANGHLIVTYTDGTVVDLGGIVGAKGDKGDTGATGLQGEQGIQGVAGATGPQGPVGPKGDIGLTGAQGPKGDQGDQGLKGDDGRGVVTSVVDANGHLIVSYTDGSSVDLGLIVGEKGDPGASPWLLSGLDTYYLDGNVGIGTDTPTATLDVLGTIKATGFQLGDAATAGQVLTTDAAGVGAWASLPAFPTALEPSGPAGGDLSGNYPAPSIRDGSITQSKLANGAVTTDKIADAAVGISKLPNGVIVTAKLADGAVTADKVGNGQITDAKIADGAISNVKLAGSSVTEAKIGANAVTAPKLASDAASLGKVSGSLMHSSGSAVGIGTAGPNSRLQVTGTGADGGRAWFDSPDNFNSVYIFGRNGAGVGDTASLWFGNYADGAGYAGINLTGSANGAGVGDLRFNVRGERMRIQSDGSVAIATSTAAAGYKLHVNGSILSGGNLYVAGNGTLGSVNVGSGAVEMTGATPYIDFHHNNDPADYVFRIINESSSQLAFRKGTAGQGLYFFDGDLTVQDDIRTGDLISGDLVQSERVVTGTVSASGDIYYRGSLIDTSDARFKTNVVTLQKAMEKVRKLRGVTYHWLTNAHPSLVPQDPSLQIGFIAQEVQAVFPECVHPLDSTYFGVDYASFSPILVEALKEQDSEIERLKEQVNRMARENAGLSHELTALRKNSSSVEDRLMALEKRLQESPWTKSQQAIFRRPSLDKQ